MSKNEFNNNEDVNIRNELIRYLNFWPLFLVSIISFLTIAFLYLRYADYKYSTTAVIEILDEAQDSEMALPTSLTVFNRSMINLENEINILSSYGLHYEVVSNLNANINYLIEGNIKTSQVHPNEWFKNYIFELKEDVKNIQTIFLINLSF